MQNFKAPGQLYLKINSVCVCMCVVDLQYLDWRMKWEALFWKTDSTHLQKHCGNQVKNTHLYTYVSPPCPFAVSIFTSCCLSQDPSEAMVAVEMSSRRRSLSDSDDDLSPTPSLGDISSDDPDISWLGESGSTSLLSHTHTYNSLTGIIYKRTHISTLSHTLNLSLACGSWCRNLNTHTHWPFL